MKNLILGASTLLLCFCFSATAFAQGGNGNGNMSGQAMAAFHSTCDYQGAVETADPYVVSACFAGGFITEVLILPKINCNVVDCSVIRVGAVGKVTFGCDGSVIGVECYGTN